MRTESKHMVTVFDITPFRDEVITFLKERNSFPENCTLSTRYTIGVVEKDGKHYLIDSDGVGSEIPLEDDIGSIFWYKELRDEKGNITSFDCMYCAETRLVYKDFESCKVLDRIPLDKFIRAFGHRLEQNFRIWENLLSGV